MVVRFLVLPVILLLAAGCSVDRAGLGDPLAPTDMGPSPGIDLGGRDAMMSPLDEGTGTDLGGMTGVDMGPPDLGRPDLGTDLGPPDLGCLVNGCATMDTCNADGTCGACVPSGSVCCPTCSGGETCMSGTCMPMTGSCGGDGQSCCSGNTCNTHYRCTSFVFGSCTHCGRSGEGCCPGNNCDASLTCAWSWGAFANICGS